MLCQTSELNLEMNFLVPNSFYASCRVIVFFTLTLVLLTAGVGSRWPNVSSSASQDQRNEKWKMAPMSEAIRLSTKGHIRHEPLLVSSASFVALRKAGVSTVQAPTRQGALNDYVVVNIEFKSAAARMAFRQPSATVFNATDRFADVFISAAQFERTMDAIAKRPDVIWLETAGLITAPPKPRPAQVPTTRQAPEQIIRGGLKGLTGQGVVIAIIDSGIDFRNPDFITYDSQGHPTSRLLYLWDTTSTAFDASGRGSKPPISYPNGASIGTLYTREQLTAELRSGSYKIPATDLNGHGTACAGIAAGNGNNDRRQNGDRRTETLGVAPEADLIAVRIGST